MKIKQIDDAIKDAMVLWEMGAVLNPEMVKSIGKEIAYLLDEANNIIEQISI